MLRSTNTVTRKPHNARGTDTFTSEGSLQAQIFRALPTVVKPGVIFFHIPNGEKRSKKTGAKLKRMGVRRGVADIGFVLAKGRAAFIELKTGTGKPSDDQIEFRNDCERVGALYGVARSLEDVLSILSMWGAARVASF